MVPGRPSQTHLLVALFVSLAAHSVTPALGRAQATETAEAPAQDEPVDDTSFHTAPVPAEPDPIDDAPNVGVYAPTAAEDDAAMYPPPTAVPAGFRVHDGFFLRLSIGPGAGQARYREQVNAPHIDDVRASGLSGQLAVAVGGSLTRSLVLHGNLLFLGFNSPTREVSGVEDASIAVAWNAYMLGGGLTHYFVPLNVYLTGTAGLTWLVERRAEQGQVQSSTGLGLTLAAGKEWWVGRDGAWGLGAALRGLFFVAPVDVGGVDSTLRGGDLGLAFSATWN